MSRVSMQLSLELKNNFEKWFSEIDSLASEFSFSNLYLFREVHKYELFFDPLPHLKGVSRENEKFIMPLTQPFQPYLKLLKEGEYLFPITSLKGLVSHPHEAIEKEKDYLYHREKLRDLPGRKLASRRNLLHQFENNALIDIKDLNPDLIQDALQVLDAWHQNKDGDYDSCKEALLLLGELNLTGHLIYDAKEPIGFILGELLPKQYLMHFAKAKPDIKGLTPFMYQTTAARLPSHIEWMNLEPDLGIDDLRQAKMSYDPDLLLEKYRIYR